ncbi:MAG: class I SAM-dependent methyltransferase [Deltaproteobacteria bacterium]|nr:class I SAM-dependent methyltransferase [Deltaproteobacteria bacterium]
MFKRVTESNQCEFFSSIDDARTYAEKAKKSMMRYKAFLANLRSLDIKGRYREIGAGPGVLTVEIARNYPEVEITALELLPDMVTVGRKHVAENKLENRITYVIGDVEDERSYHSLGEFDLVYSTYSLHHWANTDKAVANLYRAVKKGGMLYIYDLRRVWWLYWIPIKNGFFNSIRASYVHNEIKLLLRELGIDNTEIKNEFPFMHSIFIKK